MREAVKIQGMSCQHCVAAVTKALESVEGIEDVRVDLNSGRAEFEAADGVSMDRVRMAVREAGYEVVG